MGGADGDISNVGLEIAKSKGLILNKYLRVIKIPVKASL